MTERRHRNVGRAELVTKRSVRAIQISIEFLQRSSLPQRNGTKREHQPPSKTSNPEQVEF